MANPPIKTSSDAKQQAGKISIHKRKNDEKRPITDESEETQEGEELMPHTAEDLSKKEQNREKREEKREDKKEKREKDKERRRERRGKDNKKPENEANKKPEDKDKQKPSDGLPPRAVQTAMEMEMEKLNELLGVSAEENQRVRKPADFSTVQPEEPKITPSQAATPEARAAEDAASRKAAKEKIATTEQEALEKATTTTSRLSTTGLTSASAAIPEKDPLTEIKKQAVEHGRTYARPYGSYKSFPSPANTGSEAVKAHLAAEKAAADNKAQAATSTPQVNSDGTIAQAPSSDPLELFLRKNLKTAADTAPEVALTTVLTKEQAAKFYPTEFAQGYNRGFNEGYTQGLQAKQIAAKQEAEARKERLKTTDAYKEGARIGTGLATAADAATAAPFKAAAATADTTYCQKYRDAKSQNPAPSNLAALKDLYDAYTIGFNDTYAQGVADAQNAKKAAAEAKKTSPEYIKGQEIAQKEVADSLGKPKLESEAIQTAAAAELQTAKDNAPEQAQKDTIQQGYIRGFNSAYATAAAEKSKAPTEEEMNSGEFGDFYKAGIAQKTDEEFGKLVKEKTDSAATPMSAQQAEQFRQKARSYYIRGYNKKLKDNHDESVSKNAVAAEAKKMGTALFRQGKMIGKLIGMLTVLEGDVNKFLEGKPELMATLAKPLPVPEEKTTTDAPKDKDATQEEPKKAAEKPIPLSPATTLDKLKAYLFSKSNIIEVPKKSEAELSVMDATVRREYELAIALAENRGEEADKERGYNAGFNEAYTKAQGDKQKIKKSGESNPEFEAGYKDGLVVGKMAADAQAKQGGTPEQKAKFRQELDAINEQARAQGALFYQGYLKGFNRAFTFTAAGEEVDRGIVEIRSQRLQEIIAIYEKVGDAQMADRLTTTYEDTYKKIHDEIYEKLTKPFAADSKAEDGKKFVGFPTERELQEEKTNAVKGQVGADGELSKPFKKELEDTKKKLEFAKATKSADEAKLTQLVDTINGEIAHMEVAYVAAYDHASDDAKEEGYSFVSGYEAKVKALYAEAGSKPEMDTPSAVPAGGKYENKAEIKKGTKAAEAFAHAIRVNALLESSSYQYTEKDKDGKDVVKTAKYKADKSLAMPPIVVSNDFKAGYEEGEFKWKVIKLMKDGIPVPTKLKSHDLFKEMSGGDKEPKPLSTIVRPSAEAVAETKKDDAAGTGEIKEPKPIKRTALLPTNSAGAIEKIEKQTDEQALDVEFYKRKIMLAQVEALQGELSSRKKAAKSTYLETLEKAKGELLNAYPKKDEKSTEAPIDENKKQAIRQEFDKALTAFETAANSSSAQKEDKNRYDAYSKALKNDPTLKKPTALSTREEVERYVKMFDATIVNFKDNNYEAQTFDELAGDAGSLNNVLYKIALAKIGVSRKDATPEQIAEAKAAAQTQAKGVRLLVAKSALSFKKGYEQGMDEILKATLEKDDEDETTFGSAVTNYAKEIGYAKGFVETVRTLGIHQAKQQKALRLIKKFIAGTEFNLPIEVTEKISDLDDSSPEAASAALADPTKTEITPSKEFQKLLGVGVEGGGNKEFVEMFNQETPAAIQSGSRDGLAAYNLSTDTFSFAATGANKQRKDGEMLRFAGPLGEEVHRIFEEIIKSVQSVQIPKGMKDEVEKVNTALKSATTAEKLLEDAAIKAFFNRILNSPPKNGSTVDANQNPVADTQTEAQKADPKPLLPKDATEEQKTAHTQALAEWQKREDERALDLRRVLGKQNAIVDLSKGKESLTLPSTKNLNYSEGTLDLILAAGTTFQFKGGFLNIATDAKEATQDTHETTVSNSNKTFALMAAGVKMSKTDTLTELTKVKVIIPSLQKGLAVQGAKVSLAEVDAEKYIKLPSASASLKLNPEGLKKELYAMHNNLMSYINDKEIGSVEKK